MKSQILLFGIIFLFLTTLANAQNWGADGARWWYDYSNFIAVVGYSEVWVAGDTLLAGQQVKILERKLTSYRYNEGFYRRILPKEWMYERDDIVYRWSGSRFDTLYNFNAAVGDAWTMDSIKHGNRYFHFSTIVTGRGTRTINGNALRWLTVNYGENYSGSYRDAGPDTLVEGIGSLYSYMLPWDRIISNSHLHEGGMLKCYENSRIGKYQHPVFEGKDCDFIATNVNDKALLQSNIQISPNPFTDFVKITFEKPITTPLELVIHSVEGRAIKRMLLPVNAEQFEIPLTTLHRGYYLLTLMEHGRIVYATKVVKM